MNRVTCEMFDESVEELAVGALDEPLRTRLLTHASGCIRCQTMLDRLSSLTDQLLLWAPAHEPPAGFEDRVLARFDGSYAGSGGPTPVSTIRSATPSARAGRPARRRWWTAAAVAAAVVMIAVGGVAVARHRSSDSVARSGVIVSTVGDRRIGTIRLVRDPAPHVLVTIDDPAAAGTTVSCELEFADGRRVVIGTWDASDVAGGVWAVGVGDDLLDAVSMRLLGSDRTPIATATLS